MGEWKPARVDQTVDNFTIIECIVKVRILQLPIQGTQVPFHIRDRKLPVRVEIGEERKPPAHTHYDEDPILRPDAGQGEGNAQNIEDVALKDRSAGLDVPPR